MGCMIGVTQLLGKPILDAFSSIDTDLAAA
jgi:hypothetical protein